MGSDLFWTKTLVYTELLTPGWYSSGGMTPGHRRARRYFMDGLRDLPRPSHHCGAGSHTRLPAPPLMTIHAPRPFPVTHTPSATAMLSPFRWYFSSSGLHSTRLHQNSATALTTSQPPASRKSSKS